GCDVNTALGLAVPFALIGQWINTGTNTFYAGFLPKVDKCAAAGDEKGIAKVMYTGWILYAAMFALAAFLSTYALQSGISAFVAAFPAWLVHGFEVAGGLMPAVGLALLLVVMLKKENAAYLLAGFVIMVITNCQNILPIAVIAGCIAYVNFTRDTETAKLTAASAATAAQEGDFEDGI
ncbi:PTS sugar transporter subunit IIC, partial [Gemmiger formicilis]